MGINMELDLSINGDLANRTRKLSLNLNVEKANARDDFEPPILSPGSAFRVFKLPVVRDSLIDCVMFSLWDNVLGPKIERVWTNEEISQTLTKNLLHISSHTLNGEICRDPDDPSIDTKFYSMRDRGYVVTAFVFMASCRQSPAVHSLSVIVPTARTGTFMPYYDLCVEYLSRCLACLRVQLSLGTDKFEDSLQDFSLKIQNLIELFNSLSISGVPPTIRLSDTYFHMRPPENGGQFLRRVITSHLMTCGHTVVVGRSSWEINPLVSTLCLFSSVKDRCCSRFVKDDQGWPYEPQLSVQGLAVRDNHTVPVTVSDVLSGPYPSTVIDLLRGVITQSPPCHEHMYSRREMLRTELACVYTHSSQPDTGVYPTSSIFRPVNEPESLVTNLCNELADMAPELKVAHIDQFMRSLERRALLLIKYVQTASHNGEIHMKNVDKMRRHLDLKLEGDFRMVLATAERLKEGIYGFVLGDPKLDKDQFFLDSLSI